MLFLIVMNPNTLGEAEADGRLHPRLESAGGKGGMNSVPIACG